MKTAIALIATGLIVVVGALLAWDITRPSVEAGNPIAFEQALTVPGEPAVSPTPTSTTLSREPGVEGASSDGGGGGPAESIPAFTIGPRPQGHGRIPVGLRIPALDQHAPINPAGVEDNGEMEVPDNVTDVAWYKYGSAPGNAGSAVLAAHVDLAGQGPGVFFELRDLEPGSVIYIDFDDGTTEAYVAEARAIYDKEDLPTEAIFSRDGPPVLTLVTCGGGFNQRLRRYDSNVVVYAVPLEDPAQTNPVS